MKANRRITAVILMLVMVVVMTACGPGGGQQPAEQTPEEKAAGTYKLFGTEVEGYLTESSTFGMESELTLEVDGTGYMTINDQGGDVESWVLDGGNITIYSGLSTMTGTCKDGVIILDLDYLIEYYAKEDADLSGYQLLSEEEFKTGGGLAAMTLREAKGYYYGTGENGYDKEMAEQYFIAAAEAGNGDAWYYIGKLYEYSDGEDRYENMRSSFTKAIENDSPLGLYGMARIYEFGYGVEPDYEKARDYYQQAIDRGLIEGNNGLGHLYGNGKGIEPDAIKALSYYTEALKGKDLGITGSAKVDIARLYYEGENGIDQDYEKALSLIQEALEDGYPGAYGELGDAYYDGLAVEQDYAKALEYYEQGAALCEGYTMSNIGWMYESGTGVEKDLVKAKEWYEKAAANGSLYAMNKLGCMYYYETYQEELGIQDYDKAYAYFQNAAYGNYSSAFYNIGVMHYNGDGREANKKEALVWLLKAAENGNGISMYLAASIYQNGYDDVPVDLAAAKDWYLKAKESGYLSEAQIEYVDKQLAIIG